MPREMTRKPVGRRTVKSIHKAVAQQVLGAADIRMQMRCFPWIKGSSKQQISLWNESSRYWMRTLHFENFQPYAIVDCSAAQEPPRRNDLK